MAGPPRGPAKPLGGLAVVSCRLQRAAFAEGESFSWQNLRTLSTLVHSNSQERKRSKKKEETADDGVYLGLILGLENAVLAAD